ncbi:MAG: hypothetical protein WA736_02240 [Candidatus Acidiferrum sp.]
MAREETSESLVERRLDHESGEAQAFCRSLAGGLAFAAQNDFDFAFFLRVADLFALGV